MATSWLPALVPISNAKKVSHFSYTCCIIVYTEIVACWISDWVLTVSTIRLIIYDRSKMSSFIIVTTARVERASHHWWTGGPILVAFYCVKFVFSLLLLVLLVYLILGKVLPLFAFLSHKLASQSLKTVCCLRFGHKNNTLFNCAKNSKHISALAVSA